MKLFSVREERVEITEFTLYDNPANGNPNYLSLLSVGDHPYPFIPIHGNIIFTGESGLSELRDG